MKIVTLRLAGQNVDEFPLIDGPELYGKLVDYYAVFISCLDSDGTHSLQMIHWWASDVTLNFSNWSNEQPSLSTSGMLWGGVHFQQIVFIFWGELFL